MHQKLPILNPGDTVAILSISKSIQSTEIEYALNLLKQWGLKVHIGQTIDVANGPFAGTDALRTEDLQQVLDNPSIKAVFFARGGYGAIRVLPHIDWTSFKQSPKWLIGFSDITVIHQYVNGVLGYPTLHASMPVFFQKNTVDSLESIKQILFTGTMRHALPATQSHASFDGKIIGGNLSILYSLLGTEYCKGYEGNSLFIEEIDEYRYHIDRMLQSMELAGVFSRIKAILVGGMTDIKDNPIAFPASTTEMLQQIAEKYQLPILLNVPAGHIADNRAIILGAATRIIYDKQQTILSTTVSA